MDITRFLTDAPIYSPPLKRCKTTLLTTQSREIILEIVKHLGLQDLLRLQQASKIFYQTTSHQKLWESFYQKYFFFRPATHHESQAWKLACQYAYEDPSLYKIVPSIAFSLKAFRGEKIIFHNKYVATTNYLISVQVWDISRSQTPLYHLQGNSDPIQCLAMNNEYVIAGIGDAVVVWNLKDKLPICLRLQRDDAIICVTLQGYRLLAGTFGGNIERWKLSTTIKHLSPLKGNQLPITALTCQGPNIYAHSQSIFRRGGQLSTLHIWKPPHSNVYYYEWKTSKKVICYAVKNGLIAAGFSNGKIKVWNSDKLEKSLVSVDTGLKNISCLAIDAMFIAAGFENGMVKVWDRTRIERPLFYISHRSAIQHIEIQSSGSTILTQDAENIYATAFTPLALRSAFK